jgi:hypothetical protein
LCGGSLCRHVKPSVSLRRRRQGFAVQCICTCMCRHACSFFVSVL